MSNLKINSSDFEKNFFSMFLLHRMTAQKIFTLQ